MNAYRRATLMVLSGALAGAATVLITAACAPPTQADLAAELDSAGDVDVIGESQVAALTAEVIQEDDPRWDCRLMGNHECGVQVGDAWYVITFDDAGAPLTVRTR
jgi:hypothetical protein